MTSGKHWLTVIGIGEDGISGLGDEAKRVLREAVNVFGGKRQLELAKVTDRGQVWQTPFDVAMADVLALRGQPVCVLASGDPFHFGVGVTLARHVDPDEMRVLPAPSSFSLAAARLGWALQDIGLISLHGRPITLIRPQLQHGRRLIALTSDEKAPGEIAGLLTSLGFGASQISVLEALGGPDERITRTRANDFTIRNINPLNVLAIEVEAAPLARTLPLTPGLPDEYFENDGQITKYEVRALTLSALAPRRGELLWDIGAGSGSIGIEWMLADPSMRAIAIEADATRAASIGANAATLGVPGLRVITGAAPAALAELPLPDAIFIGGGGSEDGVLDAAIDRLRTGGRLVANAVTLEMGAVVLAGYARLGGTLTRISIERATAVGSMHALRPALPILQWKWLKP